MSEFGESGFEGSGFGGRKKRRKKKKPNAYDAYGSNDISSGRKKKKRKTLEEILEARANAKPVDDQRLYERAFRLLAARARSIGEMRDRLARRADAPAEGIERVVKRLIDLDYLDDKRFALEYGSFKARYSHLGPSRVSRALQTLKVPEDIIEQAILEIYTNHSQEGLIEHLVAKRLRIKGSPTNWRDVQKLSDYLFRRGFSHEQVREQMTKLREDMREARAEAEADPDQAQIEAEEKAQDEEMDFLLAKFVRIKGVPKNFKEAKKLSDRLMRRGYPYEKVREKVDAVWKT